MLSPERFPNEQLGYNVIVLKYDIDGGTSEYTKYYPIDDISASILYGNGGRVFEWDFIKKQYVSVRNDIDYLVMFHTPILCYQGKSSCINTKQDKPVIIQFFSVYELLVDNIKIATIDTISRISLKMISHSDYCGYLDITYGVGHYIRFHTMDEWHFDFLFEVISYFEVGCELNGNDIIFDIQ